MGIRTAILFIIAAAAIAAAALFFTTQGDLGKTEKSERSKPAEGGKTKKNYAELASRVQVPIATNSQAGASAVDFFEIRTLPADKQEVLSAMNEAAITYDPASLPVIAPHLKSPDPEIRAAAVDAIVVLGDAAGSTLLRQAAKSARSREEASDLQQKADYLELPPATPEFLKEMRALREQRAARQKSAAESGAITQPSPVPSQR